MRLATESAFIEVVHAARALTRSEVVPRDVRFAHPAPSDTPGHTRFFGRAVEFGAPSHELVFRDEDLALPLVHSTPDVVGHLRAAANEALARRDDGNDPTSPLELARTIIAEEIRFQRCQHMRRPSRARRADASTCRG